jgi:hypothetical protein
MFSRLSSQRHSLHMGCRAQSDYFLFLTTKITTTTNKPTTITPIGTELDQNPVDFKSNHSS